MPNPSRLREYVQRNRGPFAAVFDIGTRASRLLVGPKSVPTDEWQKRTFFNDSDLSNLGADVGRYQKKLPIGRSRALECAVGFMRAHKATLADLGIADEDVCGVGTAIFRWLEEENQKDVLDYVERETGVRIKVIEDRSEAQISLAAISFLCGNRCRAGGPSLQAGDCIILLDQGGGSMEVSWASVDGREGGVHSFDLLGTTALRNDFFTRSGEGRVDPDKNRRRIRNQSELINAEIDKSIAEWEGYSALGERRVHAYAMGSAVTNCFPGKSNYDVHNRMLTVEEMDAFVRRHCDRFEASNQLVMTLYKALEGQSGRGTGQWDDAKALENDLVTLYGLPVYERVLKRFGLSELRVCGYGLRYGYYLWKHHFRFT